MLVFIIIIRILLLLFIVNVDKRLFDLKDHLVSRKNKVLFSMAIGNSELMHECFSKHLCMGTARMK